MKKIAVVLSGCGVNDGSEIYESVLTLLALQSAGVEVQCMAPDMEQMHVINHYSGQVAEGEVRNVLVESARLARGEIIDLKEANPEDYSGAIFPGGFGAAKNLCNFATKGADCSVNAVVRQFAGALHQQGKPLGFICIAPVLIPKILGANIHMTIGKDIEVSQAVTAMGGCHDNCEVDSFVVDEKNKVVSTPAFMLATNMLQAKSGIDKLVLKVLELR